MRYVAHLVSVLLLLPGIVVAAALLALGHVTVQPSFARMVDALLEVLLAFLPLLALTAVAWLALAALGLSRRWHRVASILVALVAVTTSGVIVWLANAPDAWSAAGIFVPGAVAIAIAVWLASTDLPPRAPHAARAATATKSDPPSTAPRSRQP